MNTTKYMHSKFTVGALALAVVTSVYSQDVAPPAAVTNSTPSATGTNIAGAAKARSCVRFEGTDVYIGNLPPVTFHGFASAGFLDSTTYDYLARNTKQGSFEYDEFGLNASMSPFARTRISAQGFAFDVGNVGEYEVMLDYALVDYSVCNEFGIRAGRFRRPEGIYNSTQDIDVARTSIILPQGMYDARWRDFSASADGGSFYGDIRLGKAGSASYEAYGGVMNLTDKGGVARELEDRLRNPPPGSPPTEYIGVKGCPGTGVQLWWNTPLEGLRAGVAYAEAFGLSYDYRVNIPQAYGGGEYKTVQDIPIQHYSLEYQWKSWTFQAEYRYQDLYSYNQKPDGQSGPTTDSASDCWYAGAAYQVNKWFQVGAYYTEYYANVANRNGHEEPANSPNGFASPSDAYQKDAALSFRFDPKPWWTFKVEGHAINGTGLLYDATDNPESGRHSGEWLMLAVKNTFSF
jgi:hypothetical protein